MDTTIPLLEIKNSGMSSMMSI